jgi:hypothetical protein
LNEVQLLRQQLRTERQHGRAVAALCERLTLDNSFSYDTIVRYYLDKECSRAAAHLTRMSASPALTGAESAALAQLERALGAPASAGVPLARAPASRPAAARCAALLLDLIAAAERVETLVERRYSIEDWRDVARVDADSMLEERRLWGEIHRDGSDTQGR